MPRIGFYLVGSRGAVGPFDRESSDYDFIVEVDDFKMKRELFDWLESHGFKPQAKHGLGYGPDRRLEGACVWSCDFTDHPSVDILPMSSLEASRRLKVFKILRQIGDEKGGLFSRDMKRSRQWPVLWEVLARFEGLVAPDAEGREE